MTIFSQGTACSIVRGVSITVNTQSITWDHPRREDILQAIREKRFTDIPELMSPVSAIRSFGEGKLTVENGEIKYKGKVVSGKLHVRILDMIALDLPVTNFIAFLDAVEFNPSYRVREHLFDFLDYGQLPITEKGTFLARKVVDADFFDYFSHSINWAPGETPTMERKDVDDDPNRTCSAGLHIYNRDYGRQFMASGGKFLVVEIDPADVVSIPVDYNNTKMRVCKAFVLQEITNEDDPEFFESLCFTHGVTEETNVTEEEEEECYGVGYCSCCHGYVGDLDEDSEYCPYCGKELPE